MQCGRRRQRRDYHLGGEAIRLVDELDAVAVVPRVSEHRMEVGFLMVMRRNTARQRADENGEHEGLKPDEWSRMHRNGVWSRESDPSNSRGVIRAPDRAQGPDNVRVE